MKRSPNVNRESDAPDMIINMPLGEMHLKIEEGSDDLRIMNVYKGKVMDDYILDKVVIKQFYEALGTLYPEVIETPL